MVDFARLILRGGWLAGLAGIWAAAMLGGSAWALGWVWLAAGLAGTGAALLHDLARLRKMRGPAAATEGAGPRLPAVPLGFGIALGLGGLGLGLWAGGLWCLAVLGAWGLWGITVGPARRFRPVMDALSGLVRALLAAIAGFAALTAL